MRRWGNYHRNEGFASAATFFLSSSPGRKEVRSLFGFYSRTSQRGNRFSLELKDYTGIGRSTYRKEGLQELPRSAWRCREDAILQLPRHFSVSVLTLPNCNICCPVLFIGVSIFRSKHELSKQQKSLRVCERVALLMLNTIAKLLVRAHDE